MTDTLLQELSEFTRNGTIQSAITSLKDCYARKNNNTGVALCKYFLTIFRNHLLILDYYAEFSKNLKNYRTAFECYDKILSNVLSKDVKNFYIHKKYDCVEHISNEYVDYTTQTITKSKVPLITLTMTTCKRLSLFKDTINSFLTCCTDKELIDEWIIIDDNSPKHEIDSISQHYPFFKIIQKTMENKGHPKSMNILTDIVTTPYMFHLEDDWKFFEKRPYITECLSVLNSDLTLGQCLINKNYGELPRDIHVPGGFEKETYDNFKYVLHEYYPPGEEYNNFLKSVNGYPNSSYWPHFSLRPSLIRTEIFRKIGNFNEKAQHFEMEYSNRYVKNGYRSAFLNGIYSIHTGRLTSEIHDKTKLNAYILNGENQFEQKIEKPEFQTFVINLDSRKDRWEKISKALYENHVDFKRFPAIDGKLLKPTEQLQRIFDNNDYNMKAGMVGCAMSHIKLLIDLVNSEDTVRCIMEDDIRLVPNFKKKLDYLYKSLPNDFEFCYLGCHLWKEFRTEKFLSTETYPIYEKYDTQKSFHYSIGGTGGYIVTKSGAKKILDYINTRGMTNCIDTIQQRTADIINMYYSIPHLFHSDCWTTDNDVDSDIQRDTYSLALPIMERITEEKKLYKSVIEVDRRDTLVSLLEKPVSTIFYYGTDASSIQTSLPHYLMGKNTLVITNETILYPQRLMKNNIFNVDDALLSKTTLIYIGEHDIGIEMISPSLSNMDEIIKKLSGMNDDNHNFISSLNY